MVKVTVKASRTYDIIIGENLLCESGTFLLQVSRAKTAVIVSDDKVASFYADTVEESLQSAGFAVLKFVFPNGEASKCADTYLRLLSFLANHRVTRSDLLVALGGGVVGDLTGFAAATYLRGIDFVQIPTTVLAAVDSSVGGKTAIDLPVGKNLVGAFYQPKLVLCDTKTFETLEPQVYADGCAEIIKYGCIADAELFDWLMAPVHAQVERVVARCVSIKRDIVMEDEFDRGLRATLNFGHTIGHAIEAGSHFQITHGQAVAIGMVMITQAAERLNWCEKGYTDRLVRMLKLHHLPTRTDLPVEKLLEGMTADKKRSGDSICLIVSKRVGESEIRKVTIEDLNMILQEAVHDGNGISTSIL